MVKKIISIFWNNRIQFLKYSVTGSSSFVLDMGSLFLITNYFHFHPALSVAMNQLFILSYVFFMNKYWSFESKGQTRKQAFRFGILMTWNYVFSIGWMWLWVEVLKFSLFLPWFDNNIGYMFGRLVSVIIQVSWNFLLYKFWIYKNPTAISPAAPPNI